MATATDTRKRPTSNGHTWPCAGYYVDVSPRLQRNGFLCECGNDRRAVAIAPDGTCTDVVLSDAALDRIRVAVDAAADVLLTKMGVTA